MAKVSIIVPCFNEEESLPLFFSAVKKETSKIPAEIEYWFIDDGSTDNTLQIIQQLRSDYPNEVCYLSFTRNFGKEAAMYAGFKYATGDYVAVMDADLQDPPNLLPKMYEMLQQKELDCVGIRRTNRNGEGRIRSFFSHQFYKIINSLSYTQIVADARDYRMMKRQMVDSIISMPEYNRFSKGIFSWVGYKTMYLSYENAKRVSGKTHWTFWQLLNYGLDGIINFSDTPLSLAIWLGVTSAILSFIGLILVVIRHFIDPQASAFGWSSLVCIFLMISGVQLICLGIVGKYVGKIYIQSKRRPIYIIKKKCGKG